MRYDSITKSSRVVYCKTRYACSCPHQLAYQLHFYFIMICLPYRTHLGWGACITVIYGPLPRWLHRKNYFYFISLCMFLSETTTKTECCTLIVYGRSSQLERSAKTLDTKHPWGYVKPSYPNSSTKRWRQGNDCMKRREDDQKRKQVRRCNSWQVLMAWK